LSRSLSRSLSLSPPPSLSLCLLLLLPESAPLPLSLCLGSDFFDLDLVMLAACVWFPWVFWLWKVWAALLGVCMPWLRVSGFVIKEC
jgi:hypothetical protein